MARLAWEGKVVISSECETKVIHTSIYCIVVSTPNTIIFRKFIICIVRFRSLGLKFCRQDIDNCYVASILRDILLLSIR